MYKLCISKDIYISAFIYLPPFSQSLYKNIYFLNETCTKMLIIIKHVCWVCESTRMNVNHEQRVDTGVPRAQKKRPTRCRFPCRVDSAGPVSPTCN